MLYIQTTKQREREILVIDYRYQHRLHLQHGPVHPSSLLQFCGSGPLLHALLGAPTMLQTLKHRAAQTLPQSDWQSPGEVVVLNGNTAQDVLLDSSMQERSPAPGHVGPGLGAQIPVPWTPVSFFL